MVSSSTPNATAKPSSVRNVTGSVPSTANVPASTTPAEVITPPVAASPISAPAAGAVPLGFLAHAGHQEDVVVDAQRDQEHEHEQRERGVRAGEAEHVVEDQRADAERRRERQHHGRDQHDRRDERPQQQPRMRSTTSRMIGMIRLRSCAAARWMSRLTAVFPPTSASAPGTACTAARTRSMVAYAAWLSGAEVSVPSGRRGRPRSPAASRR